VGTDHREAVAERDDDGCVDTGELFGQNDVLRDLCQASVELVVPVDTPQVGGRGSIAVDAAQLPAERARRGTRVGELTEGRQ
jgi:hypothetical protein